MKPTDLRLNAYDLYKQGDLEPLDKSKTLKELNISSGFCFDGKFITLLHK